MTFIPLVLRHFTFLVITLACIAVAALALVDLYSWVFRSRDTNFIIKNVITAIITASFWMCVVLIAIAYHALYGD